MRKKVSLNYNWYFTPNFHEKYLNKNFEYQTWEQVDIPHTMKLLPLNYFNEQEYQFTGFYTKELNLTKEDLNYQLFLKFHGVMNRTTVYINNQEVFINEGGYIPFTIEINDFVLEGQNIIKVKVEGQEIQDIPPFGNLVDYLGFSGIYREVFLEKLPKIHFDIVHLFADDVNVINQQKMLLNLKLKINDPANSYNIKLKLFDDTNYTFEHTFEEEFIEKGILSIELDEIIRWDITNPKLYNIQISLLKDNQTLDIVTERFGFRSLMFTENGFLLNNKLVKLMGLNRHQSYPYIGYAAPKSLQELDAEILKDLGCNIVRTSHYMQSDHFLNRCDELGILVFEEIPGWNYIGNDHFQKLSLINLETMINHHFNHPSIALWGVRINESKDLDEFYELTNELAKSLDPSRQTGGVRNFKKSHLLEDVYTYNDFSHVGDNDGLENPRKVSGQICPYLVTEYNGHVFPTKKFDSEVRRIEHSLRHLNVIEYSHYYNTTSGAIGWCMADYNTHFQFGSNDRICYHGVLDIHRLEKYAAYAYKSQRDPKEETVLFVASNLIPGDYDLLTLPEIVVYTNCDYIKVYRDNNYIGTFSGDIENYEYLPHPPIIVNDVIGETLENLENYKPKDAKRIKKVLLSFKKNGYNLPLKDKLTAFNLLSRKVINMNDAMELFMKYLGNQEKTPTNWRFEGYIQEELVKTIDKGQMMESSILVEPQKQKLLHDLTYDMIRIAIKAVDQYNNILDYSNESFTIETSSSLTLIGPKNQALIAGSTGIYVRSNYPDKEAYVKLIFNNYEPKTINLTIEKGILD
ncbi:MAG: beta-galactosidase [Tenericutes bacterium HGW-Tenericutes-5]|jgi:beta-galactosidase|nr:MAG: beta-galactosidase [Tenericutes bacterium HGW-Tenericutes-5]